MSGGFPTPYADVNAVLHSFQRQIAAILGDQMVGMYLYGSLALGDFDPSSSDIDLIVVTDGEIAEDGFTALREMHAQFTANASVWAAKIEAAYIPQQALDPAVPTSVLYPQFEHEDGVLVRMPREIGWAFQAYTLREHGVTVSGADPRTIMNAVERIDLIRAAFVIAKGWLEQSKTDPSWIEWLKGRAAQSFVVLTLCRFLFLLDEGRLASKPAAGQWAKTALPERYIRVIERSLTGKHNERETSTTDLDDALSLLRYAVDHIGAALPSAG